MVVSHSGKQPHGPTTKWPDAIYHLRRLPSTHDMLDIRTTWTILHSFSPILEPHRSPPSPKKQPITEVTRRYLSSAAITVNSCYARHPHDAHHFAFHIRTPQMSVFFMFCGLWGTGFGSEVGFEYWAQSISNESPNNYLYFKMRLCTFVSLLFILIQMPSEYRSAKNFAPMRPNRSSLSARKKK